MNSAQRPHRRDSVLLGSLMMTLKERTNSSRHATNFLASSSVPAFPPRRVTMMENGTGQN